MMPGIGPMEVERGELSHEMIGCPPDLDVGVVGHGNVPMRHLGEMSRGP